MATWHQEKAGLCGLYAPEPLAFKVVSNPPGNMASAVCFSDKAAAQKLAKRNGGVVIAPRHTLRLVNRPDLQPAALRFASACSASREYSACLRRALADYGDHGPGVSGAGRDHFPDYTKDHLRALARFVTEFEREAYAMRPRGVRLATMRRLASEVATRDGAGFYGPQPL